ncbi:MAG: phosphate ABC transporter permease PstA [Puniceicoccaceae bacterium]|nr:MAG: phosphate ABC transporter permease PstA [Puniceicoccaceae bacterium]
MSHQSTPFEKNAKPAGEIWVWVTGVGLAIGLSMIVFLLSVIVWNGLNYFWPKKVAEITLAEVGRTDFRGERQLIGVITQQRALSVANLSPENADLVDLAESNPDYMREMQVYTGNRDVFATQNFAYLNMGDIEQITYPEELMVLERMEWGNAIVRPRILQLADGTTISAEDPEFSSRLREEVKVVREQRSRIFSIERREMGRINAKINRENLEIRYLNSLTERTAGQEAELEERKAQIEQFQIDLAPLEAKSSELRQNIRGHQLTFELVGGQERTQSLGDIVNFYQPNQMSRFQRTGWFFFKIWEFLSDYPREANTEGGVFPALFGTFVMTLLMSLAVTPFGVLAAVYLREYAKQGPLVSAVRISINNLAGVPAIVFGVFGLGFFIHEVGATIDALFYPRMVAINTPVFGTGGILWASLTLALMTVPVVIVATEEALAAVSRGVREGSLACGASKWQTIQRLVLPASSPGILTGLILAMARGAGEVAPLLLVGVMALAPSLPVDDLFPFVHLDRKFMHLGFHIYIVALQSPDTEATKPLVFASTLVLILLVVVLNLGAILIRNHLRKKLQSSAF